MNNDVVIIELDRPRQLKFTHSALKTLVSLTNKSIEEIDAQFEVSNFDLLEQMVYCGLLKDAKDHGETLTLEQIPELLDYAPSFAHQIERVNAAWRVAFGADQGNQQAPAEQPEKNDPSTGKKV